ncbi:hypothetical protein N752_09930 [Desulforamulus aquiferis]|nr:hypothetical protein N752_09930 [Desulforamulus aquiferis]
MNFDKQAALVGSIVLVGSAATQYFIYDHIDWAYSILMSIVFIILAPYITKKKKVTTQWVVQIVEKLPIFGFNNLTTPLSAVDSAVPTASNVAVRDY